MKLLRSLFGFTLVALALYGGYKVLPLAMSAYEFEDALKQEAKINAYNQRSELVCFFRRRVMVPKRSAGQLQPPDEPFVPRGAKPDTER